MKNFFIRQNKTKKDIEQFAISVKEYIESKGACASLDTESPIPESTECILVLGGDGTMLRAVEEYHDLGLPFLGINLGTIGYLSAADKSDMHQAIDQLLCDDYIVENRMMLRGEARLNDELKTSQALNEIVVTGSSPVQLISLSVYVNGLFLHRYEADGLIVSTPTGSTGYSMSAGGPIINPVAKNIILTPICPHAKTSSSIVLSYEDEIKVLVDPEYHGNEQKLCVYSDGTNRMDIESDDEVRITAHTSFVKIVKLKQESFLETLNIKMQE